jgi:hypothetical protein
MATNSVSALEFSFDYPENVNVNEDFTVSLELDSVDKFDVKIFIHNSEDEKTTRGDYISDIYNPIKEEWQDSWYYIKEAFPENRDFKVKALSNPGKEICLRIRKAETQSTYLKCQEILVSKQDEKETLSENTEVNQTSNKENSESSKEPLEEEFRETKDIENGVLQKASRPIENDFQTLSTPKKHEPIRLGNTKDLDKSESEVFYTKQEKIKIGVVVAFSCLTVIVIIFLALNKL